MFFSGNNPHMEITLLQANFNTCFIVFFTRAEAILIILINCLGASIILRKKKWFFKLNSIQININLLFLNTTILYNFFFKYFYLQSDVK